MGRKGYRAVGKRREKVRTEERECVEECGTKNYRKGIKRREGETAWG